MNNALTRRLQLGKAVDIPVRSWNIRSALVYSGVSPPHLEMNNHSTLITWTALHEPPAHQLALLSADEALRAGQAKAEPRRLQLLCGRVLLRETLQRFTKTRASDHEIVVDERGKPHCKNGPALSIAHSGPFIVCAVSDSETIGVDIELSDRPRNSARIARHYFSAAEAAWLKTQNEDRFYMLWVLKEAWLKASGRGLSGGLDKLQCRVAPPLIEADTNESEPVNLHLFSIDNALLALASERASDVTLACWNTDKQHFDVCNETQLIASTLQAGQQFE